MTRDEFLTRFGDVFENRPDLALAVWERGSAASTSGADPGIRQAFLGVLRNLPPDKLVAFFNGHPDLAGRSTRPDGVTAESRQEQGSAGLDGLDAATEARLLDLNRAYRERFGFPFILAVRGKRPAEILGAMEARLRNADAQERAEALRQVERIILSRLEDRLGGA